MMGQFMGLLRGLRSQILLFSVRSLSILLFRPTFSRRRNWTLSPFGLLTLSRSTVAFEAAFQQTVDWFKKHL